MNGPADETKRNERAICDGVLNAQQFLLLISLQTCPECECLPHYAICT